MRQVRLYSDDCIGNSFGAELSVQRAFVDAEGIEDALYSLFSAKDRSFGSIKVRLVRIAAFRYIFQKRVESVDGNAKRSEVRARSAARLYSSVSLFNSEQSPM